MDLLIASNSVPLSGAATAPTTGVAQYAGNGNTATLTPPTELAAYHYNSIMLELTAIILKSGQTLDRTNLGQILAALITMFSAPPFPLVGSGSLTVPAWSTRAVVRAWGAGGAGGGAVAGSAGAGGSSGGFSHTVVTGLTPGATIVYEVGVGGTGSSANGTAGGNTFFDTAVLASGGPGGGCATVAGANGLTGGVGGTATGSILGVTGSNGQDGIVLVGAYFGGMGGGAPFGGGITYFPVGGTAPGNFPGGGGSGGADGANGGNGAGGYAEVTWLP